VSIHDHAGLAARRGAHVKKCSVVGNTDGGRDHLRRLVLEVNVAPFGEFDKPAVELVDEITTLDEFRWPGGGDLARRDVINDTNGVLPDLVIRCCDGGRILDAKLLGPTFQ